MHPALRNRQSRRLGWLAVAAVAFMLPACESGGHFTLLGYTTRPNYNCDYRTIYVPMFKNRTYRRGLEMDLTRAVVREIEAKTPYKVVSNCDEADTELLGTIVSVAKNLVNINQENEVREAETTLGVEIIWRDRRTGEILSKPIRSSAAQVAPGQAGPSLNGALPSLATPGNVPNTAPPFVLPDEPPPNIIPAPPVLIQAIDHYIPEVGGSTASGLAGAVNQLAIQIVSMMEQPW
jgi:hypothetical protein